MEFSPVLLSASEIELLRKLAPKLGNPAPGAVGPASLRIARKSFRLVQDRAAQDYIQGIGKSLIPAQQRDLSEDNPFKVPFAFYLVADKSTDLLAFPSGAIVVPTGVFNLVENEAQLAFLLSDAITEVRERVIFRVVQGDKLARTNLGLFALSANLTIPFAAVPMQDLVSATGESDPESLINQSERVGMQQMIEAGYDAREAPRTWKSFALKQPRLNPVAYSYSVQANRQDLDDALAARRALLMAQLRQNYAGTDLSTLKKDSDEFHKVAMLVLNAGENKQK